MDIMEFIKELNPKMVVEIGGHFGIDTEKIREILPNSSIITFEPDPRNIRIMKSRGIDKICQLEELAISDQNGPMNFYLSSGDCRFWAKEEILRENDWSASSSLKKPKLHLDLYEWIHFTDQIEVRSLRLDDYYPLKNEIIDFIWMDVQGAEDLVLKGSMETLKRTRYIYTEFDNAEIYENQLNLEGILNLIGPDWIIKEIVTTNDVLLKNIKY